MSAAPGRMATIISQQPWFMAGTPEQRRLVSAEVERAHRHAQQRKARVKARPDLAERLRRSLGYARFDQWNGYVPKAESPIRTELLAIFSEVANRDATA